ncbi:MAG: DUF3014 domain-containing protein [Hylemonella sp.]|uniref:DUF3014 domain-containing protein n=1 Tax=Hylemonella sp. TaxID=2066020 RepID=UPI0022C3C119|nr:DUF3014 domain-containing protein [Hylemonella sp.]MCZ8252192.1 DUF3014 domain-containing protein [Hylemonella sp.]
MNKSRLALALLLVLVLLGAAAWYYRPQLDDNLAPVVPQAQPVQQPVVAAAPVPAAEPPAPPPIQHPVQAIEAVPPPPAVRALPPLGQSDARAREDLNTLLGRKKVEQFLLVDSFVRRAVATIDNLGREHAAPSMWPVHPTPGRFSTLRRAEGEIINPDNGQRYSPLVQFIETVNSRQIVQLYVSLYPLFQQAYEELGYPKAYFNDRLIAVIDLLLATPVREDPLIVGLVEVKGPIPSERPWTRYEFEEDELQSLAAGQKMLLRTGPVNHRRLRAKLIEYRALLTKAALPKGIKP